MRRDEDYAVDEEHKKVHLTEQGTIKAEEFFGVESLSDLSCVELNQYILNALQANVFFKLDSNYVVNNGQVLIVDEFTGRIMEGRRYSNGLHQAIEAKEGVQIKDENLTVATITLQNFFRLYSKISGMTGTAKTEEAEFNKIYSLDVVTIPPNLQNKRIDEPDVIYPAVEGKLRAVVERVAQAHETGQPVLVGTITIEKSEQISKMLKERKIPHKVLNAKNHAQEGEIVAQAGRYGMVTIATNMAGRGTDILLGGNPEYLAKAEMAKMGYTHGQIELASSYLTPTSDETIKAKQDYTNLLEKFTKETDAEKQRVLETGGLLIIGTERHESRRIDNQLRGRAGRQGDPGRSVFYISFEDDLIRLFAGDSLKSITNFMRVDDDTPMKSKLLTKMIENAQKKVEAAHYASRRYLLEYDDVINKQRTIIYGQRNSILDGEDVHAQIEEMFPDLVDDALLSSVDVDKPSVDWNIEKINLNLEDKLYKKGTNFVTSEMCEDIIYEELRQKVLDDVIARYDEKKKQIEELGLVFADIERSVLLSVVDHAWMQHIDAMSDLRRDVGTLAYGRQDPIVAYKKIGFNMFDDMVAKIREDTSSVMLNMDVEAFRAMVERVNRQRQEYIASQENAKNSAQNSAKTPAKSDKVVGRNDPCPCGSGKKYKNCCGK